jgi:hypothetical protein
MLGQGISVLVCWLLVSFGLCFGLSNKATFLYGKVRVLDDLLSCNYCLGFHTGWMTWLMALVVGQHHPTASLGTAVDLIAWSFVSAVFCYAFDAMLQKLEQR